MARRDLRRAIFSEGENVMVQTDVAIAACPDYSGENVRLALEQVLAPFGGLDWVREGMRIAIKANLVAGLNPERCATTHPVLLAELVKMLTARGADVVVGDSPGGLYNARFVQRVYDAAGMSAVNEAGGRLNGDFSEADAQNPKAKVCRSFRYTAYLDQADVILNVCKLKSHGMMALSCGAKNLFGVVPGTVKPEYHFRYPDPRDFARMIVDLDEYFAPRLTIVDAVDCMEGNGPTSGTPRHLGALVAGSSPHKVDLLCASLIGLRREEVPTLEAALERGLIPPGAEDLVVAGDPASFALPDFQRIATGNSLLFQGDGTSLVKRLRGRLIGYLLTQRPGLNAAKCVGCTLCAQICPAKAIIMHRGRPNIDRSKCIRCFCCQEFCPPGAMEVRRTPVARLLDR